MSGGSASARDEAKRNLLRIIADAKREGSVKSSSFGEELSQAISTLEALNPTVSPADSDLISGPWSLIYTGGDEASRRQKEGLIGSTVTEITGASDGGSKLPLGRRLTTLAGRLVQNKGNFQDIYAAEGKVFNRAVLSVIGVPLELKIEGACTRVPEDEHKATRLAVSFRKVDFTVGGRFKFSIPLGWANDGNGPQGWVDTTYVDEGSDASPAMRLGRGDKGSVFVTVRRPE